MRVTDKNIKIVDFDDVLSLCSNYIKNDDSIKLITKAYDFANKCHAGQFRKSGEPYINHLLWVAYFLAQLQVGPTTIAAGLLHDSVEDCGISNTQIASEFSPDIAMLVEAVTKVTQLSEMTQEEFYAENHRKIFIAMAKDIRVILVKLADRLHNMRTLQAQPEEKRVRIARETLEVYAPIAHRLGINTIKSELEDLGLKYLEPDKYKAISSMLSQKETERKALLETMEEKIKSLLAEHKIPYRMSGRVKNIYSIYKKVFIKNRDFNEIYDLQALRIITDSETHCYEILGYIHAMYRPIPGRFKDYIAMPKPNMYQSLHTTIISDDGGIFEIQIRTEQMDQIAESGIAAHWRYKEDIVYDQKQVQKEIEEKLAWFRELVTYSSDADENAQEYMESLTKDIFDANVYVLTPKGRVLDLPNGSTPVDFAYKIHTQVGNSTIGATVNGVLVPLDTPLKTGDIVDIKTSKTNAYPKEDWLKFVKTTAARNAIKKAIIKHLSEINHDEMIDDAKRMIEETSRDLNLDVKEVIKKLENSQFLHDHNADSYEQFLIAIYSKSLNIRNIIEGFKQEEIRKAKKEKEQELILARKAKRKKEISSSHGVIVPGGETVAVSFSQCCSPIPGDEIVGYISKGQGIKIHRKDCPNIANENARLIDLSWDYDYIKQNEQNYYVDIQVSAKDRPLILVDVMNQLSSLKINVSYVNASKHGNSPIGVISLCISVKDAIQLNDVINSIKTNVKDVYDVFRYTKN